MLESGDVILLGDTAPVVGASPTFPNSQQATDNALVDKTLNMRGYNSSGTGLYTRLIGQDGNPLADEKNIGLAADLSTSDGASIAYNGNNSFTITVTDRTLSVYVY